MIVANAVGFRERRDALIDRQEDTEVGHAVGYVSDATDFFRQPRAHLQEVSLCGAEDRHGTERLLAVVVEIRIMVRAVVVEAERIAQTRDGDRLLGFSKDGERVFGHILLHAWGEDSLQSPYTWIVIGGIVFVVLGVSLVEVELALGRIIQTVLLCELDEILRRDIVLLVVGIVFAETALVTRHEILVVRHTASQKTVSTAVLEIPSLLIIDESDAKALSGTIFLDQGAESLHALAC